MGPFGLPGMAKGITGTPGDEKVSKRGMLDPSPQGPSWEIKFGLFVDCGGLFSHRFSGCRFGRFPGRILSGFEQVFGEIFEYFL